MPATSTSNAETIISSGRIPSGMSPRLNGDLLHTFRNYARHTILGHGDPIEHVCSFHRPLLVGDDQDLSALLELVYQSEETVEVHVVEGRLDLVQKVEGRRPG